MTKKEAAITLLIPIAQQLAEGLADDALPSDWRWVAIRIVCSLVERLLSVRARRKGGTCGRSRVR